MDYLFLLLGFVILIASGDVLVRGSVSMARFFKVSSLVVGVTVVSLGTSAPELFVSLKAALEGHPDITTGNVIGSNISNIALVLAATVLIMPMLVNNNIVKFDWPVMFVSGLLFIVLSLDNELTMLDGFIFLSALILYIYITIQKGRKARKHGPVILPPQYNIFLSITFIIAGITGMYFGADFLIDSASSIAKQWGVSEKVISVSIIAFGTSVPELATSIIAAIKKESDISVGNIIGSNIFNILAILGVSSIVHPIKISSELIYTDGMWMLATFVALFIFMFIPKRFTISRVGGIVLLITYIIYIYINFQ